MIFETGQDKIEVNIILLFFWYFNILGDPVLHLIDLEPILCLR